MELEGAFPPTRSEFLLGASVDLISLLIASNGVDKKTLDDYVKSGLATIYKKEIASNEEQNKRDAERTKNWFYALKKLTDSYDD